MAVVYPHHVVFDDRGVVEVLGDVVGCRAHKFYAAFLCPPIRLLTGTDALRYGEAPMKAGRNKG